MAQARRLLVVLLGIATLSLSAGDRPSPGLRTDGPMEVQPEHGTSARGPVGFTFTDGLEPLFLGGTQPATITAVRSVNEAGLTFLGAKVAGPDRRFVLQSQLPGFPPAQRGLGTVVDAVGAVIEPRDQTRERLGFELLLGYEVKDDSRISSRSFVEVEYEVGGRTYLLRSPGRLVFCPDDVDSADCFSRAEQSDYGQ